MDLRWALRVYVTCIHVGWLLLFSFASLLIIHEKIGPLIYVLIVGASIYFLQTNSCQKKRRLTLAIITLLFLGVYANQRRGGLRFDTNPIHDTGVNDPRMPRITPAVYKIAHHNPNVNDIFTDEYKITDRTQNLLTRLAEDKLR